MLIPITSIQKKYLQILLARLKNETEKNWAGYLWNETIMAYIITLKMSPLKWDDDSYAGNFPIVITQDGVRLEQNAAICYVYGDDFNQQIFNSGVHSVYTSDFVKLITSILKVNVQVISDDEEDFVNVIKAKPADTQEEFIETLAKRANPALDPHDLVLVSKNVQYECPAYEDFARGVNDMIKDTRLKGLVNLIIQDETAEYITKALQDYTDAGYNVYMNLKQTRLVFLF
jgi:hypothetical protein